MKLRNLTILASAALLLGGAGLVSAAPAAKGKPAAHKFAPKEIVAYCPKCNQCYSERAGKMIFMRDVRAHKLILEPYSKVPKNAKIVGLGRNGDVF
jgi:hypothetical protein